MNAIDKTLLCLKKERRIGLMTHAVIGYPSLKLCVGIVLAMAEGGADFIELQIPFSDPLADGPTIMRASEQTLKQGFKVRDAFRVASLLKRKIQTPLLFMAYYNTVFKYSVSRFCRDAARAGVSGLIVPDMPLEEETREHLAAHAKKNGLHFIRVVSPASTESRLRKNAREAKGFVYCSARQGITGAREDLAPELVLYLKKARRFFDCPLAVGFGISRPEHIKKIAKYVDVAVIGSAVIDVINSSSPRSTILNVRRFIQSLK